MIYLELYWTFFQIGLLAIGGGYATLPMIKERVIIAQGWMTQAEFLDLLTLSQMTPGPIAINASTFTGFRVAGMLGAVVATLGCVSPACVIVTTLAYFYKKYQSLKRVQDMLSVMRPAAVGLIASAGAAIIIETLWPGGIVFDTSFITPDVFAVVIFILSFCALRFFKAPVIIVIITSGAVALAVYLIKGWLN
ncbi:MAG: chromate transporter [Clostridiales bacterium]|jgi:chromate transporter|nr:chromate transporter [Clostridiales bacterium]